MAAWLHHGNNPPQDLNCLTSLGRSTSHIGNKTKLSSLFIDRQLKFKITAWPKLGNKAAENGNKSIKCTGSYFTAVKASSHRILQEFIRLGPVPYFPDMSEWNSGPIFSGEVRFFPDIDRGTSGGDFENYAEPTTRFSLFLMSYSL